MKKYMTLKIRANDVPVYGEIEAESLKDSIVKIASFLFDQTIDGDNHLAYVLENEHVEFSILEDGKVALLGCHGDNIYVSD